MVAMSRTRLADCPVAEVRSDISQTFPVLKFCLSAATVYAVGDLLLKGILLCFLYLYKRFSQLIDG
ncbi:hypothetical protein ACM9LZ_02970 [Niveispirillum fermenti]